MPRGVPRLRASFQAVDRPEPAVRVILKVQEVLVLRNDGSWMDESGVTLQESF